MIIRYSKNKLKQTDGFTMIEFLIYIALTVIILAVMTDFSVDVVRRSAKAAAVKTVQQNSRYLLARMVEDIKAAEQIVNVQAERIDLTVAGGVSAAFRLDNTEKAVYYSSGGVDTKLSDLEVLITSLNFEDESNLITVSFAAESKKKDFNNNPLYSITMETRAYPRRLLY